MTARCQLNGVLMWESPDFEIIEAGAEITAYIYQD
jgi:coenzyme PQQ precursor peptide PqqA